MDEVERAEVWRPIPGYEGRYDVSDLGRVRSYLKPGGPGNRGGLDVRAEPIILCPRNHMGYRRVTLAHYTEMDNRKQRTRMVHHLVLYAFVGPRPKGREAVHLNRDRGDNRLENLRWGSTFENRRGIQRKVVITRSKLGPEAVRHMRALAEEHKTMPQEELAVMFGVCQGTVSNILKRKTWKHV